MWRSCPRITAKAERAVREVRNNHRLMLPTTCSMIFAEIMLKTGKREPSSWLRTLIGEVVQKDSFQMLKVAIYKQQALSDWLIEMEDQLVVLGNRESCLTLQNALKSLSINYNIPYSVTCNWTVYCLEPYNQEIDSFVLIMEYLEVLRITTTFPAL